MVLMGLKLRGQQGLLEDVSLSFPISRGCPYSLAYVPFFSVSKASLVGPSLHHGATSLILSCESLCYRTSLFFSVNRQSKHCDATGVCEQEDRVSNLHPQRQGAQSVYRMKNKEAAWSEAWGKAI